MNFDRLTQFIDSLLSYGIPGSDLLIQKNHQTIYRHFHGWRDREAQIPLDGTELYYLYSCSKITTVTAAMQLYEKGLFLLDDPLSLYLPEFERMQVQMEDGSLHPAEHPILIRHLFAMTAGFNYDLDIPGLSDVRAVTGGACPTREVMKLIARTSLSFEPGTRWQYSLCHDVLAGVVEVISGMKFRDYVQKNIFDPLGMCRSSYHPQAGRDADFAAQYRFNDATRTAERIPLQSDYIFGTEYDSGGAGIISSVEDYGRIVDALACGGIGATGEHILSRASIDLMRENQLNAAQMERDFVWQQMCGYGYGLGVRTAVSRAAGGLLSPVGEFGWGGAAGAYIAIIPEEKISIYYGQHMLNSQESYVHPRLRNIAYACMTSGAL